MPLTKSSTSANNSTTPYSLSDNAVYTFCKDKENGIWAGTYFGGINYFPRQQTPFEKIFSKLGENSLSGNVVREICQDHTGNIWIGTEDAGLNKLDTATGKFTHFLPTGQPGSIAYSNIHGLLADSNELWIGTFEHGLDVMNITTGKVIRHYIGNEQNRLKSNFIYCIYKTASGEIMLATTRGAFVYDRSKNDFDNVPGLPTYNWYTSLLQDEKGRIWAGTFGIGVQLYDTHTHISKSFMYDAANKNSLASNRVNGLFEDSESGFGLLPKRVFANMTKPPAVLNAILRSMASPATLLSACWKMTVKTYGSALQKDWCALTLKLKNQRYIPV